MASRLLGPTRCLDENPSSKSIRLGGRYINLMRLAEVGGFDHGYLSYIMSGTRTPSVAYAKEVARRLGILTEDGDPDTTRLFLLIEQRVNGMDADRKRKLA